MVEQHNYYCLDNVSFARKTSFLYISISFVRVCWRSVCAMRVHEFMYDAFSVYANNNNEFCVPLANQSKVRRIQMCCNNIIYTVRSARWHWCCLVNIFTFIMMCTIECGASRFDHLRWFKNGHVPASHVLHIPVLILANDKTLCRFSHVHPFLIPLPHTHSTTIRRSYTYV